MLDFDEINHIRNESLNFPATVVCIQEVLSVPLSIKLKSVNVEYIDYTSIQESLAFILEKFFEKIKSKVSDKATFKSYRDIKFLSLSSSGASVFSSTVTQSLCNYFHYPTIFVDSSATYNIPHKYFNMNNSQLIDDVDDWSEKDLYA